MSSTSNIAKISMSLTAFAILATYVTQFHFVAQFKFRFCKTKLSPKLLNFFMLNSTVHGIPIALKKVKHVLAFKLSDVVFISANK